MEVWGEIKVKSPNVNTIYLLFFFQNINVTIGSSVTITGLETDTKYQFFAISRNQFGTSLPTSLISVNVSRAAWNGQKVTGKPSAPHGIELVKGGFISESILISIRLIKLLLNQLGHLKHLLSRQIKVISSFMAKNICLQM